MPLCIVKSCKNRTASRPVLGQKKEKNIMNLSYHRFPKNEKLKLLWLDILGQNTESVAVGARICSIHFAQDAFYILHGIKRLRSNALPSIEPVIDDIIIASHSTESNSCKIDRATSPIPGCSHFVDKSTSMSPKRQAYQEERFNKKFQYMKKQYLKRIKLLQQNVRRKECKIISFKAIFDTLKEKNMLQAEELQVLQDIVDISTPSE
ncbi:uncharacterized protein LOC143367040 [Andrena cerasifolii]|uniref:uncharacterized protein LOC143367040 n=1 Tax=Andrena cerasifolii TaxID=2819439 RepID=UPI004037759E